MKLPPDFKQRVMQALAAKQVNPICSSCGKNNWTLVERVVTVTIQEGEGYSVPPPFVPSLGMLCNNCGYIRLHALKALDIDVKDKQEGSA